MPLTPSARGNIGTWLEAIVDNGGMLSLAEGWLREALADLDAAEERERRLRGGLAYVLDKTEWCWLVDEGDDAADVVEHCPECGLSRKAGHGSDCGIAKAAALLPSEEPAEEQHAE
jgi:hypothetical protein